MNDCIAFPHLKGPQDLALPCHDLGSTHALVQVACKPRLLFLGLILCTCARAHTLLHNVPTPSLAARVHQRAPQLLYGPNMKTEAQPGEELVQKLGELLRPNSQASVKSIYKW